MPITLTFAEAFAVGGDKLLPAEFLALVAGCEGNPEDYGPPGVAADWLDENGEPDLAAAFRWIHKRQMGPRKKDHGYWSAYHLPAWVRGEKHSYWHDSYLGHVIGMAAEMKAVRESMEK